MAEIPGWIWLIINPLAGLIIYAVKRTPRLRSSFGYGIVSYFICGALAALIGYISTFPPYFGLYNVDFALIAFFFASIWGFWSAYITTYQALGEAEKKKKG